MQKGEEKIIEFSYASWKILVCCKLNEEREIDHRMNFPPLEKCCSTTNSIISYSDQPFYWANKFSPARRVQKQKKTRIKINKTGNVFLEKSKSLVPAQACCLFFMICFGSISRKFPFQSALAQLIYDPPLICHRLKYINNHNNVYRFLC